MKVCTEFQDKRIKKYQAIGYSTKQIVKKMNLLSAHVIYGANRRNDPVEQNKSKCREITAKAIRRGLIKKQNCFKCGSMKAEVHHKDYSDPFDVLWMCRNHHLSHHAEKRKQTNGAIDLIP